MLGIMEHVSRNQRASDARNEADWLEKWANVFDSQLSMVHWNTGYEIKDHIAQLRAIEKGE
jgi:hypothetical protein